MKKRFSGVLAMLLVIAMGLSLVACGDEGGSVVLPGGNDKLAITATFDDYLATVKVGSVEKDMFAVAKGGLTYKDQETGKMGIMSYVGLHDTGAVYSYLNETSKFFAVSKKAITENAPIADLNSVSLVDGNGKVYISGYAYYQVLDDRYAVAKKVTARCYVEDEALLSYKEDYVYSTPSSDKTMYKGTWCIYDLQTGKKVPGIGGNKNDYVVGYGDLFKCEVAGSDLMKTFNCKGQEITGKIFDNGTYAQEGKVGTIYKPDGSKVFDYDLTGYTPIDVTEDGNYYLAQLYQDGEYSYAMLDKKGNIASKEFAEQPNIEGELLMVEGAVYNYEGVNVIEGTFDSLEQDDTMDGVWMLRKDDTYTMINKDGGVFFSDVYNDDVSISTDQFVAYTKKDDDYYVYSHKDHDYTIKGFSFAPWVAEVSSTNNMYNLVDTMTGEIMLEGYKDYSFNARNEFAYYVYAKYNGGADVYLIVAGSQLAEVEKMKQDLLNDLIKAFEDEGIQVTIDKETGAMSLGSDILFQPDKAELSAQGKTDLGKFLKAYSKVAFSDKYAGFINKTIIEGHIAPDGDSYASGLQLSEDRANVVLDYCLSAGKGDVVNSLQAIGYSNSQPVYNEDGSVNMEKSRRVSFRFMMNIEF